MRSSGFRELKFVLNDTDMTTVVKLHCPCGVVDILVPIKHGLNGRLVSDPERQVSFVNVASFATGIDIEVSLPSTHRWPELGQKINLTTVFCYGGAFYCVVKAREPGFPQGIDVVSVDTLSRATGILKEALIANPDFHHSFTFADQKDLSFLYGMIVVDDEPGRAIEDIAGGELGLRFFAAQQVDRSPCGSGVAARRVLAHAKGLRPSGTKWTYQSLVSNALDGVDGFVADVIGDPVSLKAENAVGDSNCVVVEGRAFYTGYAMFMAEPGDIIEQAGFSI